MLQNRKLFMIFTVLIMLALTGCWDYREVNQIAIVAGAAIDKSENGRYLVTVEIMNPKTTGAGTSIKPQVIGSDGVTIFDAVRNIIMRTGKKLYWSHAKVIIISKDIAEKGIVPILDWVNRDTEVREEMLLLVSRDKTAKEIFATKPNTYDIVSFQISDLVQSNNYVPKFPEIHLWDFMRMMASAEASAIIPTIKTVKYRKDEKIPQVYGTAIFKKDKMVGWLDGNGTRNLLYIQGKAGDGLIPLEEKHKNKKCKITLEVFTVTTDLKASKSNNQPLINVKSKIDVSLAEIGGTMNFATDKKARKELEKDAEVLIARQMQSTIRKVQKDYKADIFGFGGVIKRQMPDKWRKLEPKWAQKFSKLKTKVSVDIQISESASTSKPIKVGD